jgi:outer membrane protein with beta-barrel domain
MYFHPTKATIKATKKTASIMKLVSNKLDLLKCAGIVTLSLLLLAATATSSQAQSSLQLGLKAGGNYMKIGGNSFDGGHYFGLSAGVYGKLNFSSKWSLQPELDWNETVAQTSSNFPTIYPGGVSQAMVYLQYVAVPVLVSFKPIPELSLLLGPQYGFLVSQTSQLLQGPGQLNEHAFNQNDLSIVFGGQANLGKVILGLRYSVGLNNICFQTTESWRQYGLQFYVGYQLKDIKLK